MRYVSLLAVLVVMAGLFLGCDPYAKDLAAIESVMNKEVQAHVEESEALLREVFTQDAVAIWRAGTADESDDMTFDGVDAIIGAYTPGWAEYSDHQFELTLSDPVIDGDTASIVKSGEGTRVKDSTGETEEWNTPVGETWKLERRNEVWMVVEAEWQPAAD